jgi:hypothetical protein
MGYCVAERSRRQPEKFGPHQERPESLTAADDAGYPACGSVGWKGRARCRHSWLSRAWGAQRGDVLSAGSEKMTGKSKVGRQGARNGRNLERVSCLMVTQEGRLGHFERSLRCYVAQDYPKRELVVVTAAGPRYREHMERRLEKVVTGNVSLISAPGMTLGRMRSVSVAQASGPLVCQWDDDDFNHPHRLSAQIGAMRHLGAKACFLYDHLHFFPGSRKLYWCNWERSPFNTGHPGTLLAYKDSMPPYDATLTQSEDTAAQQAILRANVPTVALTGLGHLYVYVCHGKNTFPTDHHLLIARKYGAEEATLRKRAETIRSALVAYPLKPPLSVVDHMDRVAFVWSRRDGRPASLAEQSSCRATWVSGTAAGSSVTVTL